jgi:hypothetical protein
VRLAVEFPQVNWSKWQQQVDVIARTSAGFITHDANYLYLVPDLWSIVRKVAVDDLLHQPDGVVMLTDSLVFEFKDRNFTLGKKIGPLGFDTGKNWVVGESKQATALAACNGWIIAGTDDGFVYFIPEDGDVSKDQRRRKVGNPDRQIRSILDASCLQPDFAYTVSFDAGNGQIQNGKLSLIAKYYVEGLGRREIFAAAPLDSGGFIFWDGVHVMKVVGDQRSRSLCWAEDQVGIG